jgi:hypothetical protein
MMRTLFQVLLSLLLGVVGFFGTWMGMLTWRNSIHPWIPYLAVLLIGSAVYFLAKRQKPQWLRFSAVGFLIGAGVLGVALSYGRMGQSFYFGIIVLLLVVVSVRTRSLRAISKVFAVIFVFGWVLLGADHALLQGQVYAWKWRVMEQPVFGPGGFSMIEHHGRCTIYVTDAGFVDPSVVAVVWGWHVFPKVVFLGDNAPEGRMIDDHRIQEVIR